eukprot:jgi/Chlat1/3311/Chrsp22S00253
MAAEEAAATVVAMQATPAAGPVNGLPASSSEVPKRLQPELLAAQPSSAKHWPQAGTPSQAIQRPPSALSDAELQKLIDQLVAKEGEVDELQEDQEEERFHRVHLNIRNELAATLAGSELEAAVADEVKLLLKEYRRAERVLKEEVVDLQERLEANGVDIRAFYFELEKSAKDVCKTDVWREAPRPYPELDQLDHPGDEPYDFRVDATPQALAVIKDATQKLNRQRPVSTTNGKKGFLGAAGFSRQQYLLMYKAETNEDADPTEADAVVEELERLLDCGKAEAIRAVVSTAPSVKRTFLMRYLFDSPQEAEEAEQAACQTKGDRLLGFDCLVMNVQIELVKDKREERQPSVKRPHQTSTEAENVRLRAKRLQTANAPNCTTAAAAAPDEEEYHTCEEASASSELSTFSKHELATGDGVPFTSAAAACSPQTRKDHSSGPAASGLPSDKKVRRRSSGTIVPPAAEVIDVDSYDVQPSGPTAVIIDLVEDEEDVLYTTAGDFGRAGEVSCTAYLQGSLSLVRRTSPSSKAVLDVQKMFLSSMH